MGQWEWSLWVCVYEQSMSDWVLIDRFALFLGEQKEGYLLPFASYRLRYLIGQASILPLSHTLRPDGSQCSREISLFLRQQGSFLNVMVSLDLVCSDVYDYARGTKLLLSSPSFSIIIAVLSTNSLKKPKPAMNLSC